MPRGGDLSKWAEAGDGTHSFIHLLWWLSHLSLFIQNIFIYLFNKSCCFWWIISSIITIRIELLKGVKFLQKCQKWRRCRWQKFSHRCTPPPSPTNKIRDFPNFLENQRLRRRPFSQFTKTIVFAPPPSFFCCFSSSSIHLFVRFPPFYCVIASQMTQSSACFFIIAISFSSYSACFIGECYRFYPFSSPGCFSLPPGP